MSAARTPFLSLDVAATRELLVELGGSAVHAGALRRALLAGRDPSTSTRAPKRLVDALRERVRWTSSESEEQHPAEDGSVKHLLRLSDERVVETVRLPGTPGGAGSACLSSQVGCAMACRFCASGLDKVARNLEAHELLEQVVHLRRCGEVRRVVFMGSGEPTQNLRNLAVALDVLRDEAGIGPKYTMVSTVGPASAVDNLADLDRRFTLALSLHSARPTTRAELIPTQTKADPESLIAAADRFAARHRRPYQVEYVLLAGVNDGPDDAHELARLLTGRRAHVSAIRWNAVGGMEFQSPSAEAARAFVSVLHEAGISARLRRTVGGEATAACGQLRARRIGAEATGPSG